MRDLSKQSAFCCQQCNAVLAYSFGAGVQIGNAKIVGKMELICAVCDWGNLFYPRKNDKREEVKITSKPVLVL